MQIYIQLEGIFYVHPYMVSMVSDNLMMIKSTMTVQFWKKMAKIVEIEFQVFFPFLTSSRNMAC